MAEIQVFENPQALQQGAAKRLVELARAAIADHGAFHIALAGGSTPRGLYEWLARPELSAGIDWSRWHIWFGDERSVPPDHPDSNYRMAREALLDHVPIPDDQIHRMIAETDDREKCAKDYEGLLQDQLPRHGDGRPRFDLVLLGMGPDGHTASLFPGTTILEVEDRLVAPVWVEKLDTWRMSLTYPAINAAGHVMILATGESKAEMIRRVLGNTHEESTLPIQRIRPAGELEWFLDTSAAGRLSRCELEAGSSKLEVKCPGLTPKN